MALVKFATGSLNGFNQLETKDNDTLYFINDTHQIYKGAQLFSKSYEVSAAKPTGTGKPDVLYIATSEKKMYVWNGTDFVDAFDATFVVDATVADGGANPVSGEAVFEFVKSEIGKLVGGESGAVVTAVEAGDAVGTLVVTNGTESETVNIKLTGLVQNPTYDAETRKITLPQIDGQDLVINLGKDMVVKSGSYDAQTKEIVLVLTDDSQVKIPASALVDIYTGSTGTISITVGDDNVISADVKVKANNELKNGEEGLYVDLSAYAAKSVVEGIEGRVATLEGVDAKGRLEALEAFKTAQEAINADQVTKNAALTKGIEDNAKAITDAETRINQKIATDIAASEAATKTAYEAAIATAKSGAEATAKAYTDEKIAQFEWITLA